eukprot:4585915-Prymnesium_polylepis.2
MHERLPRAVGPTALAAAAEKEDSRTGAREGPDRRERRAQRRIAPTHGCARSPPHTDARVRSGIRVRMSNCARG